MKVILIKPPVPYNFLYNKIEGKGNYQQPLGLAYVASYIREKGIKVSIIDALILNLNLEEIQKKINKLKPEIIGISSNTIDIDFTVKLAEYLKKNNDALIVIGGPHITATPRVTMKHKCFDVGVIGEGEITFYKLLKNYKQKKFINLNKINGIAYRKNNKIIINSKANLISNLDILPLPARDLLPSLISYEPTPLSFKKVPLGSIITSRGCPYQCTYCDKSIFGNKVRMRSPNNIVSEIEELKYNYKIKEFRFWDDIFNINKKRVIEICKLLIKKKINLPWTCICRVDLIDKEQLYWMKKSGCWQISLGIESGNNHILKSINKGFTKELVEKKINEIVKNKIKVRGFFIIGVPKENVETIKDTINFAKKLSLDSASFSVLVPFPNTKIFKENKVKIRSWSLLRENDPSTVYFCPKGLNKKEFVSLYKKAYKSFYLRPSYILRRLFEIRSWHHIKSNLYGLKNLLGIN